MVEIKDTALSGFFMPEIYVWLKVSKDKYLGLKITNQLSGY